MAECGLSQFPYIVKSQIAKVDRPPRLRAAPWLSELVSVEAHTNIATCRSGHRRDLVDVAAITFIISVRPRAEYDVSAKIEVTMTSTHLVLKTGICGAEGESLFHRPFYGKK